MKKPMQTLMLFAALAAATLATNAAAATQPLRVYVRLLVGRTGAALPTQNVLVVPGVVILPGESAEQKASDVLRLIEQLKDSYRLDGIESAQTALLSFALNKPESVPSVAGGPEITALLLARDDKQATLRFTLRDGGETLAEPVISILQGGRAVVGCRDGAAAPYLFLVVESLPDARCCDHYPVRSEPKRTQAVAPTYPEAARRAKFEGVVVLECTIGTDGTVRETRVIRGEPMGLTEAAIEAVKQWRYEPVRDTTGQPVEARMTSTVSFRLH